MSKQILVSDYKCDLSRVLVVNGSELLSFYDVAEYKRWLRRNKSCVAFPLYDNMYILMPNAEVYRRHYDVLAEYIYMNDLEPCFENEVRRVA